MFQDTRQRNDSNLNQDQQREQREQKEKEQAQKAQNVTDEIREKMLRGGERSYESQAANISGRLQESLVRERAGASTEQIQSRAEQQVMPELEQQLGQLEVPLAQDTSWTVRDRVRQAIMRHAAVIDSQRTEEVTAKTDKMG